MNTEHLLIEIGTEELPPDSITLLSAALEKNILSALDKLNLSYGISTYYSTPRRLAVYVQNVEVKQATRVIQRRGPSLTSAFEAGQPTAATLGFARSCQCTLADLDTLKTEQGEWLVFNHSEIGQPLTQLLPPIFQQILSKLPIAKKMRWSDRPEEFVRPVHWILALLGSEIIPLKAFNLDASNKTYGHRFHHPDALLLTHPKNYVESLKRAYVMVDTNERKKTILQAIQSLCTPLHATPKIDPDLLDHVTNLVEWPTPLIACFDKNFLALPTEVLISSMQYHQRCFALFNPNNQLLNQFILVSNTIPKNKDCYIIQGNERVMHARLSDAQFFFEQDKKQNLKAQIKNLQTMVFQKELGSLFEKIQRVQKLVTQLCPKTESHLASRAAALYKTDLLSLMVNEFPELQGIMGAYYASFHEEPFEVCQAIRESYLPRFAKDKLPKTPLGTYLALADKLDSLVGLFNIAPPTGEKDPFGLRRQAIAILRILVEKKLPLDLLDLLSAAAQNYQQIKPETIPDLLAFCFERFKAQAQEKGIPTTLITALLVPLKTTQVLDFTERLDALCHFQKLPQAEILIAAHKRVHNILTAAKLTHYEKPQPALFQEAAEKNLYEAITQLRRQITQTLKNNDYTQALLLTSRLKEPIDCFFDQVMVNVPNEKLKKNRLYLLAELQELLGRVANLAQL